MDSVKKFFSGTFYKPKDEDFEKNGYLTPSQF